MIHDRLSNARAYSGLGPRFAAAFEWLASTDLMSLAEGRVDLKGPAGSEVYALVQSYETEGKTGRSFESHRLYADIQVLLSGTEVISYRQAEGLAETASYDGEKDFALWRLEGETDILLRAGEFAVFLPPDAHAPKIASGKPSAVRKIVVKVRVSG